MHEVLDEEPVVRSRSHQRGRIIAYVTSPTVVLLVFFVGPMAVLGYMSFLKFGIAGVGGYTGFDNYHEVLTDPTFWEVLWTTFTIGTFFAWFSVENTQIGNVDWKPAVK